MTHATFDDGGLIWRLQRALPLSAHGRPALLAFLRSRGAIGSVAPGLRIVGVFQAGGRGDPMCRFTIKGGASNETFIAPLAQLSLDRGHPAARELASRRRRSLRHGAA